VGQFLEINEGNTKREKAVALERDGPCEPPHSIEEPERENGEGEKEVKR
jgi:hypothetical protein